MGGNAQPETWWGTQREMFGPRNAHRLSLLFAELKDLPPGALVLDAAAGLGDVAERLKARGYRVIGVDLSFEAILIARHRTKAPLVIADVTALPFRDGTFDALTSSETIEHVPDDRGAAREFGRVLRTGGTVVVTVPALEAFRTCCDRYYEHLRRYSRAQLTQLFREAGFTITSADFWGFPFVLAYDYCFLLPVNLRRARHAISGDASLRAVAAAGKRPWLVNLVRRLFGSDRFFRWVPLGVGLVMSATKSERRGG